MLFRDGLYCTSPYRFAFHVFRAELELGIKKFECQALHAELSGAQPGMLIIACLALRARPCVLSFAQ